MEFEIIKETENPLFKRKEIQISLDAETTPSEKEMIDSISQKFSTQPENISMEGIHGKFGSKTFTINANIYSSQEEKQAIEQKKKKSGEQKPAEGEAVPSEAPAETPAPATETPAEQPSQEQAESKEGEKKEEAQEQELAKPDEEPTQVDKVEEKPE